MNDHDPEYFRPLIATRSVASNDRNAKRFAPKTELSPALHPLFAGPYTPCEKTALDAHACLIDAGLDVASPMSQALAPLRAKAAANNNRMLQNARATDNTAAVVCYASPRPQLRTLACDLPAAGRRECGTRPPNRLALCLLQ